MSEHQAGDLWIGVTTPSMTEIHAKYFESFAVSVNGNWGSYGGSAATARLEIRMNLSAFVRDAIAEAVKGNLR